MDQDRKQQTQIEQGLAALHRIEHRLEHVELAIRTIDHQLGHLEKTMTQQYDTLEALRVELDAQGNVLAKVLEAQRAQIKAGMTEEEAEKVRAGFQTEIDDLKAMGKDPEEPLPPLTTDENAISKFSSQPGAKSGSQGQYNKPR